MRVLAAALALFDVLILGDAVVDLFTSADGLSDINQLFAVALGLVILFLAVQALRVKTGLVRVGGFLVAVLLVLCVVDFILTAMAEGPAALDLELGVGCVYLLVHLALARWVLAADRKKIDERLKNALS